MTRWRGGESCPQVWTSATGNGRNCYWTHKRFPDTFFSFSFFLPLIGIVYGNHTFKYSTTTCLRNVRVSGMPPARRCLFDLILVILLLL